MTLISPYRASNLQQQDGILRWSSVGNARGTDMPAVPQGMPRQHHLEVSRVASPSADAAQRSHLAIAQVLHHHGTVAMASTHLAQAHRGRPAASSRVESQGASLQASLLLINSMLIRYRYSFTPPIALTECPSSLPPTRPCARLTTLLSALKAS